MVRQSASWSVVQTWRALSFSCQIIGKVDVNGDVFHASMIHWCNLLKGVEGEGKLTSVRRDWIQDNSAY